MFKQEHTSSQEAHRQFSSQEAGDILNIAARLSDDAFSQEQLEAIAEEAGISREAIHRAIQEHQRQIQAEQEKKRQREERRRHWHRTLPLVALVFVILATSLALYFAFAQPPGNVREMRMIRIERSGINLPSLPPIAVNPPDISIEIPSSETTPEPEIAMQEVTGRTKRVYTRPAKKIPFSFSTQSIYVEDLNTNETITAVPEANEVHHLTLSPSENQLAYFTGKSSDKGSDLWVVNTDGTKLCHITNEGGALKLSDGRTASVKGTEVMWADNDTLIVDTSLGRMEIDLDENNVPGTARLYKSRP